MTEAQRPWWSSGAAPGATAEPGPAAEDRVRREEERRRFEQAATDGAHTRGGHADDGHADDAHAGHGATDHGHAAAGDPTEGVAPPAGDVCQVCPICTAMRLVGDVRPDLVAHLAEAARHLTLAAKTVIDAHASGFGHGGLEHIPLDDDPR